MKKKILFIGVMLGTIFTPIISIAIAPIVVSGTKIPKPKEWYEVPNSKITNGHGGTIFQAKNGDLYAMGKESKLRVLKNGEKSFEEVPSSNIFNGGYGTMFQARNGDLYAMGYDKKLQVLKNGGKSFEDVPSSKVIDGYNGTIFQANNGDLYAMGYGSKLEVLKNGKKHFEEVLSSKITNGYGGIIFQASNGDLYAMGYDKKLQVLKNGGKSFEVVLSSNITNGVNGTMFQASNGDLYAMGEGTKLQVLKNGGKSFEVVGSSNITNGAGGTIFQASNGDLYAMGGGSKLEVLKNGEKSFKEVSSSNITNGASGTIFQARNGDLYAMGKGSKLQILKNGEKKFEEVPSSNIIDGAGGTIFQAKNGDLYAMGYGSKLQVLKNNLEFEIINQTSHGTNDAIIKAKNFINHYSKLQYKNSSVSKWIDLSSHGEITNLVPGVYNFKWVGKHGETYKDNSLEVNLPNQIIKTFVMNLADIKIKEVTNKTTIVPTRKKIVKRGIIPTKDDLNPPTQKGFSFSFKSATAVNNKEESTVIYIVDVNPKIVGTSTKDITFVVGGFDPKDKVKTNNQKIILATTIPIGLISLIVITWLLKHFFFKSKKKHKKIK